MTMLAGIFSRRADCPIQDATCDALKRAISRNPDDERFVFRGDRVFLVKTDINAFGQPAFRVDSNGSVSMLVGEPLFDMGEDGPPSTRDQDLAVLHEGLGRGVLDSLTSASGVFCAVHYHPTSATLALVTDKLGLRPLYYFHSEKYVIFATALRILEALAEVPKQMDLRGVTEMTAFGYPLGGRTPYSNITLLKAAEVVQASEKTIIRSYYCRWGQIRPSARPEPELLREVYDRFTSAILRRIRQDRSVFVFLSGGLDSRCISAILRSLNVAVHSINFAPPGTQDRVFGALFAKEAGTIHEEFTPDSDSLNSSNWLLSAKMLWASSRHRKICHVDRPYLVWNGNGGSLGVAHVGLTPQVHELLREAKREAAIEEFLRQEGVHVIRRLFKADLRDSLLEIPKQGLREELEALQCTDPARGPYLFLLINEQQYHMSEHFSDIDLHRLEYHLPFYDSRFLESILTVPIDFCPNHRFYLKWLRHFPPAVMSIPWQTYPGSEPCPLPIPPGLPHQWERNYLHHIQARRKVALLRQLSEVLASARFPQRILNRGYLRLVSWIYWAGLRDYSYVIPAATAYHTYWVMGNGDSAPLHPAQSPI